MYRTQDASVTGFGKRPIVTLVGRNRSARIGKCEQMEYFCRTTANHGFAHVMDSNELPWLRVAWAVVLVCFTSLAVMLIYMSAVNLVNRTLTTEFLERIDNEDGKGVDLPDIHICDASIFNATRLKEMGFDNMTATYLTLATSSNAAKPSILNDTSLLMAMKDKFDRILASGNWTIKNVIQRTAIKCQDIVARCSHTGQLYDRDECCATFFQPEPFVNIFGSCISTHGHPIKQTYTSRDAGFVVYIVPNTFDIINFDETLIKPEYILQKGMYYAVSNRAVSIEAVLHTSGRFAAPNSWVSVPIIKSVIDNSELKDNFLAPSTCVDTNDLYYQKWKSPEYDHYSEVNCYLSKFQKNYRKRRNCSVLFYKYGKSAELCEPHQIITFHREDPQKVLSGNSFCPMECIRESYEIFPSCAQLNTEFLVRKSYANIANSNPVVLHFFYSSFTYQVRISHTNTILKWLGEVGGNLGLFLGVSLISILEIVALCIRCFVKSKDQTQTLIPNFIR